MHTEVVYDHRLPEISVDPYPTYEYLRDHEPVYYNEKNDLWALSRYADVQAAFRDWHSFTSAKGVEPYGLVPAFGFEALLMMDPPRHDVLRKVLRDRFTPKTVRELGARTERVICPLVASAVQADRADLAELAGAVALKSMADFMGLSQTTAERLKMGLELALEGLDLAKDVGTGGLPPAVAEGAEIFDTAMDEELAQRHREERDDLTATIARAEASGVLDRSEAISMCKVVYFGALDTTSAAIGNTLYLLAIHPERRASVVRGDVPVAQALEECMRYHSPIQWVMRTATRDVQIDDRVIPEGGRVLLLQGSANRDSRHFERADVLDFQRPRERNLVFGEGVHFCIGAPLARLWATTAITELLRHTPEYGLDGPAVRSPRSDSYELDAMPVRLRP